jgi:hypothetical protein
MTALTKSLIHKSRLATRMALLSTLVSAAPFFAIAAPNNDSAQPAESHEHDHNAHRAPAKLVQIVRDATRQFVDINTLEGTDYAPAFGCISGPDHGAMGVHYISQSLVADGDVKAETPEALIYEPSGDAMRLVGVEYIVDSATWLAHHDGPPQLEGQLFQLVGYPNRYGLQSFFELHVWAWRDNPNGAFVDWNNRVTCEGQ